MSGLESRQPCSPLSQDSILFAVCTLTRQLKSLEQTPRVTQKVGIFLLVAQKTKGSSFTDPYFSGHNSNVLRLNLSRSRNFSGG